MRGGGQGRGARGSRFSRNNPPPRRPYVNTDSRGRGGIYPVRRSASQVEEMQPEQGPEEDLEHEVGGLYGEEEEEETDF